ncbi:HIT domain-containing protein [Aureimonas flava]|uniref:HIT domain-containing protein n=1 Tax=Aureimonas flava TaxID=2320271 RepID=A0A3A1WJ07_9HYPH|nr:HIT family protein [Aureimonas flava]RIY00974.1 HIT domain-containing protein [Aureimonas flava]
MQADPLAFSLDERLDADTRFLCDLPLCRLLLMRDARWPWLILVPRRPALVELFDLEERDRLALLAEANRVAEVLSAATGSEKINLGALGNVVRQFHLHVVARSSGDPNWPRPVWGFESALPYPAGAEEALARSVLERLA